MHTWTVRLISAALLFGSAITIIASSWGQPPSFPITAKTRKPTVVKVPRAPKSATTPAVHDMSKLTFLQRQLYLSTQRGSQWLQRVNRADGRFANGVEPSLRTTISQENYLHQVAAAFTLARTARFFKQEQAAAVARQSLLTLLLETETDIKNPKLRRPNLAGTNTNRLAAAGWLVAAIHELPKPGADLLKQSEQLCNYIRTQQRADGSLCYTGNPQDAKADAKDPDGILHYPGIALYGLAKSLQNQKTAWKIKSLRAARAYYHKYWRRNKNSDMVAWHVAAFAEAYGHTKEQPFADSVFEMTDWLVTLQYKALDPRRARWIGGFKHFRDGKVSGRLPDIHCASNLEALGAACRVTRQTGDLKRFRTYRESMEQCGQFVMKLQFTTANSQHFAAWYRNEILGAFHPTPESGRLRIDYTQKAVAGFVLYFSDVAQIQ